MAFDSTKYGALTIVGFGTRPLTIDAAGQSRAASLTSGVANLGSITIEGGKESETGAGVNATGGTLTLSNATLNSKINITNRTTLTKVTLNAPTTISSQNARFDAVTANAPIAVYGRDSKLTIVNGLALNSTLTITGYASGVVDYKPRVVFSGGQSLTGAGSIIFDSSDSSYSCNAYVDVVGATETPAVVEVADALTFESAHKDVKGYITGDNGSLVFGGTLKATTGELYLQAPTTVRAGGTLKVEAASGATVCVSGAVSGEQLSFSGAGTTRLSGSYSDGELILVGSGLRRFSGRLERVTVSGASDVLPLGADSSWARFDSVTANAPIAVYGRDAKLTVVNGLALNSTLTITGYASGAVDYKPRVVFSGSQSLTGAGSIIFNASSASSCNAYVDVVGSTETPAVVEVADALTFESAHKDVKGYITGDNGSLVFSGTLKATTGELYLQAPTTVRAGGTLKVEAASGATVRLNNQISDGKLTVCGAGNVLLNKTLANVELIAIDGNAPLKINSSTARFDSVTANAPVSVYGRDAKLTVVNGLALNSTLTITGDYSGTVDYKPRVVFSGSQSLTGAGSIIFNASGNYSGNAYVDVVGSTETPAVVEVADALTFESTNKNVKGYITGDNGSLVFGGTLKATTGELYLQDPTTVRAGGTLKVEAASGATVCVSGAVSGEQLSFSGAGTTRLSGSYLDGELILVGSGLRRFSGSLKRVTISGASDVSPLGADSSWARFDAVTVNAPIAVYGSDSKLTVVNGLALNSTLTITGCKSGGVDYKPRVVFSGSQSLTGAGSIIFNTSNNYSCSAYVDVVGSTETPAVVEVADALTFETADIKVRGYITGDNGSLIYGGTLKATTGELYLQAPTTVSAGGTLKVEAASGATLALATDFSNFTFDIGGEGAIKLTGSLTDGTLLSSGAIRLNGNGSLRNVYVKAAGGLTNSGTLTLVGCVLAGSSGDGLSNSGTATLVNCVVAANKGRGVYSSGTTYVYNSIVAGNFGGDVVNGSRGKTLGENNLSVYSNWTEALYPETAQEITIADFFAVPPVFDEEGNLANADQLDLSPPLLSVATNVGDSARAAQYGLDESAFDIVGNARVYDGCVDVGAYEATGFGASQSGVFNGVVDFTWEQPLDEAVALRLTWVSGAKSSVLGVFGASGEFAWDTTSFDDGAGRLIVEYLDENDAVLRSATIAATIINDENVVVKRGTIDENETWEAGKVYLVVGRLDVASGATLTLGEGAVVKFWRGATIYAQEGAAVNVGDAATLTRAEDDAVGGDTNKDGENSVAKYGASYFKGQGNFQVSASATVKYVTTTTSGTLKNNETWLGGQVYRVTGDLVVPSGVTLTIQPGAILKFDAGKSLIVEKGGTLIAEGTSASPIVFTSIKDDAVGGDTNADNGRYEPQPGDWKQIRVFGKATFEHAQILYSGSDPNNSDDGAIFAKGGGAVALNSVVVAHSKLVAVHADQSSTLTAVNSVFSDAMYATHNGDYLNCTFANLNYLCNTNYYYYSGSFVNCVIADVTKRFMSGGKPSYNFANCVFWNAATTGEQTFYAVGSNGNIWANPLFRDAANGDYRLSAGSPCVDAADGTLAPETDADGTPRVTDAYSEQLGTPDANGVYVDIGAYEFADVASSSLDLEPVDLKAPTSAAVGETVTLEWTTRNNGSVAATGAWSDEIYLVSPSGREIWVATILRSAAIGAGDLQTNYAQVVVPEVVDGEYSFAVRVNPNRDVFEGVNVDNNVLVAQNDVKIEQPTLILSDAFEASSTKRYYKLAIPAGQSYSLRYAWPSGEQTTSVSILASEGILPTEERCDWRAVQTTQNVESKSQNIAVLYVPASDEACVVYVSFVASLGTTVGALTQNDDAFDVYGFADGQSFADSEGREYAAAVQLGQTSNVAIVGVGFQDGMTATLESVSSDGAFAVDATIRVASATSATLSFDMNVDATLFGNVYRLKVTQNGRTTTVDGLIYAKPKSARPSSLSLAASFDIPDSIREGRVYKGCVEYQNVSSEVIAFPVFTVSGTASLAFSADEIGDEKEIRLLGLGASEAAWLAPGESARVEFYFKATSDTRLSLATWLSDETTTPFFESEFWNSWREYRQDLSAAITRLDERGFRTNDYDYVAGFLRAQMGGEPTTGFAGRLQSSDSGEGLAGCELVASWSVDESEYRDYATTDENGFYVFNFLPSNVPITLSAASGAYDLSESSITLDGQDVLRKRLTAKPFGSLAGRVVDENGRAVQNAEITLTNEAGETWNAISDRAGVYSFAALKSGTYLVSLNPTGKFKPSTPTEAIVKNGIATTGFNLTAERGAEVSGKICDSEGFPLADAAILVVDASGDRFCALTDAEGRFAVGGFDEGEATITISAANCVSVVETVALTAQKTTKINKSLQNASLISGFVRNNDGTPAADATFVLTDENENGYWVSVDESGFYCVDFLPPGDYWAEIRVGETLHISQKLAIAEESDGETIDFVLSATTRLTGTATYADGQPLAGVMLTLSYENGRRYATVAEDGTYAFENLAVGVYELAISDVEQTWTVSWNGEESAPTQNVELDFIGRVSGVLTLSNGEAAATAQVYLFKDGELVDSVFANGEGRLDVYLREPGFYTFRAVHENGFFSAWEANVERGSDLTFEATAGTASAQANATGLSTDGETQTVYWSLLSVDDEGRATAESTGYSDDGAALNFVGLTPGKYRIIAYSGTKGAKSEFEISEGAPATTFDLAFGEKAILTATVQLPTGFEADGADAIGWLYDAENNLVNSAAIDDEGNLLYYFLEPGEYALVVVAGRTVGTAKLTIPANETAVSQNVELTEATVTISGSMTLDGAPIGDQGVVLIKNADGVVVGIGYSDANGSFVAYALEAESYQIVCVDYATTATATVELTGEELTGVAIRLAVVKNVCVALTTAAPTGTESATEQTAPIISNATAEEDPGNFWQKLDRQKMYYNDEILPEFLRYKSLREDCCASCGKKYDLYHRTLNAAWDDHNRAKKSLDALEELKNKIITNGVDLVASLGKLALNLAPGGLFKNVVEGLFECYNNYKDIRDTLSLVQDPELNKLFQEIGSSFTPSTSDFCDEAGEVFDILYKAAKKLLEGEIDAAKREYERTVGRIKDLGVKMKKLKEDLELAWKNLDKLTAPSSPSKVPGGYLPAKVDHINKESKNTKTHQSAEFVTAQNQREKIVALKKSLRVVTEVLGPIGDFIDFFNDIKNLFKSIDDFHRFYEECNNNMFDFRDEVRKLSEAYPPQCTNPNCSCHDDDDKDLPNDEPRDDGRPDEPRSEDPNEILGPIGYDFQTVDVGTPDEPFLVITTPNWIDGKAVATQNFTIYFENKPTATAAAQEVFVETTLSEAFDWSTFELGAISVGNEIYDDPVGCVDGVWTVEQKSTGEQIQISVEYDPATGDVKWYLRSYVASTPDHFPTDPYAGFLPPNDKSLGNGEGYVSFVVKYEDGLTTGTKPETNATIVFDANESITTNWWHNTVDADAPTAEIADILYDEEARTVAVEWRGADVGSGVACYDAYYSVDGGETYSLWLEQTTETSATILASAERYVFKIVAYDNVGHSSAGVDATFEIIGADVARLGASEYVVEQNAALCLSATGGAPEGWTYYWDLSGSEVELSSNFIERGAEFWTTVEELGFGVGEHAIRMRPRDANGIFGPTVAATLRVVATAPTFNVTTSSSADGSILRLNLRATTPDGAPITYWRLDWGDGQTSDFAELSDALTAGHFYAPTAEDAVYEVSLTALDATGAGADVVYALTSHKVAGSGAASQAAFETVANAPTAENALTVDAESGCVANAAALDSADVSFDALTVGTNESATEALTVDAASVCVADSPSLDLTGVSLNALNVDAASVWTATETAFDSSSRGDYRLSLPDAISTTERRDAAFAAFEAVASTSVLDGGEFATDCGADVWSEIEAALVGDEATRKSKRRDPFESLDVWADDELEGLGAFGF